MCGGAADAALSPGPRASGPPPAATAARRPGPRASGPPPAATAARRPGPRASGPPLVGGVAGLAARRGDDLAQFGDAEAVAEIAEAFARLAPLGEQAEQRRQRIGDVVEREPFGDRLVQPGAGEIAADIDRVRAGQPADDADIAGIEPDAAVGAAGDADAEPLALEPEAAEPRDDRAD